MGKYRKTNTGAVQKTTPLLTGSEFSVYLAESKSV